MAGITGVEVEEGGHDKEGRWRKEAWLTEDEEECIWEGRIVGKDGLQQKGPGPACGLSVCLSADTNREPMIHRRYYCQTELRLCSLAYASLIMQIRAVRQNITAAVSQSGFRRYINVSAFVSVSLATLKWNEITACQLTGWILMLLCIRRRRDAMYGATNQLIDGKLIKLKTTSLFFTHNISFSLHFHIFYILLSFGSI